MANRERGEVATEIDGTQYTLRPSFDAVCELETVAGKSFELVVAECFEGRLSGLRAVVWCLLQAHHGDEIKSLKDASAWIERAGGLDGVFGLVNEVLAANEEPRVEGGTTAPNPRRARAGTGGRSSSRRVKSA